MQLLAVNFLHIYSHFSHFPGVLGYYTVLSLVYAIYHSLTAFFFLINWAKVIAMLGLGSQAAGLCVILIGAWGVSLLLMNSENNNHSLSGLQPTKSLN